MRTGTEITISINHNLMGRNLGLVVLHILALRSRATPRETIMVAEVNLLTMELTLNSNLITQVIATTVIGAVITITATMPGVKTTIITSIMLGVVTIPITAVLGTAIAATTAVMVITTMVHGMTAATVHGAATATITRVVHLLIITVSIAAVVP